VVVLVLVLVAGEEVALLIVDVEELLDVLVVVFVVPQLTPSVRIELKDLFGFVVVSAFEPL